MSKCRHKQRDQHSVTEVCAAGVYTEYWFTCRKCGEILDDDPPSKPVEYMPIDYDSLPF